MPHFGVIVHGTGIEVPAIGGDEPPMVGFFTTRAVTARDANEASRLAADAIRNEWSVGSYASANRGSAPTLRVDDVFELSFFGRWFKRRRGYTFYAGDSDENH